MVIDIRNNTEHCLDFFFLFNAVNIPSAACIESARRKRHLAKMQAEYLPLDVSNGRQVSRRRESSEESEDESDMKNLSFAPKMRTLRQRMTEHMGEFRPFFPLAVFLFC